VVYLIEKIKKQRVLAAVPAEYKPDYAIIITAYKYIDSLPDVVNSVLKINYPNFLVYIVADNCDTSSLNFDDKRVILLRPENILKGNVKSHFFAINRFIRPHDILTIIDSDNIVHPEYLNELNVYFNEGFEAVQGLREAKNLDSTYARLDAARDIYYHYYDCKLLFNGGSSSTLSGSGMAFTVKLYKDSLENIKISGAGFDKVLQSQIVLQNKRIAFAPKAAVYDEKTSRPAELVNQRSRWINTWFKYFKFGFRLAFLGVKNFSLNQFLFGLVLLRPPLFLFLIASVMLMLANIFINPLISLIWLAGLIIFTGCFMLALISSNTDKRIYKALIDVPKFMFYQIVSLTKVRKANVRSVSTRHNHT
jgi:cellulose synthase/poly-beta-1,6-N-acetylglucosamine synthase-like glycosyltransferase